MLTQIELEQAIPNLIKYANHLCKNSDIAEDLLQDTLEKGWRNRAFYDPLNGKVLAWLCKLMLNIFYDNLRVEKIDKYYPYIRTSTYPNQEHVVAIKELSILNKSNIPIDYALGYTLKEISNTIKVSPPSVHYQLRRFRETYSREFI